MFTSICKTISSLFFSFYAYFLLGDLMKHNINLIFNEKKDLEEIISSIIVREYLKKYEV